MMETILNAGMRPLAWFYLLLYLCFIGFCVFTILAGVAIFARICYLEQKRIERKITK